MDVVEVIVELSESEEISPSESDKVVRKKPRIATAAETINSSAFCFGHRNRHILDPATSDEDTALATVVEEDDYAFSSGEEHVMVSAERKVTSANDDPGLAKLGVLVDSPSDEDVECESESSSDHARRRLTKNRKQKNRQPTVVVDNASSPTGTPGGRLRKMVQIDSSEDD